jgi:5-methylcytosine-specific restriction endonuclease McrA
MYFFCRSDFICSYTEEKIKKLGFIELNDILEEKHANYENLETETEMRELVITLMKKGNRETVKLDNSVEEMIVHKNIVHENPIWKTY